MSGLDPSDPLNLLLHTTEDSTSEESENTNLQDWAKYSSLWSEQSQAFKSYADLMDLPDFSMNLDVDYSSIGIDPSSLHFNPAGLNFAYHDHNPISSTNFGDPYSVQCPPQLAQGSEGSNSPQSSSGASLSPLPDAAPSPPSGYTSDNTSTKEEPSTTDNNQNLSSNDPAAELAHRVRQTAGVMLAVPMHGFAASFQVGATAAAGKLPIPRLPRPSSVATSTSSPNISSSAPSSTTSSPAAPLPRPKTSHTTIERRYRTNLNARIQSLRMAVPALRVLEDRDGSNGKKIKKNIKGGVIVKGAGIGIECTEDGTVVDVIDERGFVDGVKVARKCSKANVLGKAVEYIRVLKKREQRLKAEQTGLKALISGLVGGPALIREWERQWRVTFGGEEKDEVEGEDEEADDDESEDEDGDDGDEEGGRKRKRMKASSSSSTAKKLAEKKEKKPSPPVVLLTSDANGLQVPEKRKRGRPRKVHPPPVTMHPVAMPPQKEGTIVQDDLLPPEGVAQWQQQSQPQQFLLAVFALFSFFNSPLTNSMGGRDHAHHHHAGKVLTAVNPPLAYAPEIVSQFVPPPSVPPAVVVTWAWKEYAQLFHLLVTLLVLVSLIGSWFGFNVLGLGVDKVIQARSLSSRRKSKTGAGLNDWVKLGEERVLGGDASSLSHLERYQIYRAVSCKLNPSVSDLATTAMVMQGTTGVFRGLARMKAQAIWTAGKQKLHMKVAEQLVMNSMDVRDACAHIASATKKTHQLSNGERAYSPLEVLGCVVVKERVKRHLGKLFVQAVVGEEEEESVVQKKEELERRKTIEAARELGGSIEDLGRLFERAWKTNSVDLEDVEFALSNSSSDSVDEEIRSLFTALVLYTRLFGEGVSSSETECPSSMSSSTVSFSTLSSPPPPTPRIIPAQMPVQSNMKSRKQCKMLLDLRKVLGNRVFEDSANSLSGKEEEEDVGLEDARDRVVDLIVDIVRKERFGSSF